MNCDGKEQVGLSVALDDLENMVGREVGVSGWTRIGQDRIDSFADVTEDWQHIHVDPELAKASPFGGTIAHGFLTLSLLSKFAYEAALTVEGAVMGVNYGFDRVRNIAPVKAGSRIRGRFVLGHVTRKPPNRVLLTYDLTVEIEGEAKPALVAQWLTLLELGEWPERTPCAPLAVEAKRLGQWARYWKS